MPNLILPPLYLVTDRHLIGETNFLKFLGISDPFSWTLVIRLVSSVLGFVSIVYLFITTTAYRTTFLNSLFISNLHNNRKIM